jgi:hypothetical protein
MKSRFLVTIAILFVIQSTSFSQAILIIKMGFHEAKKYYRIIGDDVTFEKIKSAAGPGYNDECTWRFNKLPLGTYKIYTAENYESMRTNKWKFVQEITLGENKKYQIFLGEKIRRTNEFAERAGQNWWLASEYSKKINTDPGLSIIRLRDGKIIKLYDIRLLEERISTGMYPLEELRKTKLQIHVGGVGSNVRDIDIGQIQAIFLSGLIQTSPSTNIRIMNVIARIVLKDGTELTGEIPRWHSIGGLDSTTGEEIKIELPGVGDQIKSQDGRIMFPTNLHSVIF